MRRGVWTATACVFLAAMGCSSPPATGPSQAAASQTSAPAPDSGVAAETKAPAGAQDVLSVLSVEHEVDVRARREGMPDGQQHPAEPAGVARDCLGGR